jgi:hypothetical protein
MSNEKSKAIQAGRRSFLKLMTGGSLLCLGCGLLNAAPQKQIAKADGPDFKKYRDDAKMSMEKVFDFTWEQITLKVHLLADIMSKAIGREKFLEYLKEAGEKSGEIDALAYAKKVGKTDLRSLTSELSDPDYMVTHILTYDILKDTDKEFEVRIKGCLWAKTFRKHGAEDIGFAMFCNRDYRTASAFNPKIKLIRDKTLMEGCDHCNHRWVYEG